MSEPCEGCAKGLPLGRMKFHVSDSVSASAMTLLACTASSDYQSERIAIDTALVRLAAQLGVTVPVDVSGTALVELIAKEVAG